ncbi:MAG: bifunctional [glutamate--ammonia ligase]-adenylyl-L-tyrosine phosphorylase/[glutamate--ammonia-ligase] adenylyltransferase [bacterium]|jgi:glutamate-ammonia-ligase adenylyltransferase|nr:bifunctional [glutamate--ammonia ligase]-adenylyl-L-tyrosine phosphorylase/[glutamate--ammonia-ligase] adenylyltransferase [bacterium]
MNRFAAQDCPLFDPVVHALTAAQMPYDALSAPMQDRVCRLVRFSPRLASFCAARIAYLLPWLQEGRLETPFSVPMLQSALQDSLPSADNPEIALRQFHRQHMVGIALRDICELAEIQEITEELSNLADVVIQTVFAHSWQRLVDQYGPPVAHGTGQPAQMAVIALGKHGGRELNFSSDVDLMFVYDTEGETSGGTLASIPNRSFFTFVAQKICDCLTKATADGFLYRVDTRLRPEGKNGPLASSLMMIEEYYHFYGQNWERQALLKARAVAGPPEIGKKFIKLITPFTYRKYVDEMEIADALRSIDRMRNRSLEMLGSDERRRRDFKNGYGGIRDIEFFTQAVQILYGGQYPEIRHGGTLLSLLRMHESGLLHSKEYGFLALAYQFLRRIEHRLQMVDEKQVYQLPTNEQEMALLAENLGYPNVEQLKKEYEETTRHVRALYAGVFQRKEWEDSTELFFDKEKYDEDIEQILREHEFLDPERAYTFLKDLGKAPDAHLQAKMTRLYKAIFPRLLACFKRSPDSDMALGNFEKLVTNYKARISLYETLGEQPPFLDLLVSVISCSSFLTTLILRDPSLMDSIGGKETFEEQIEPSSLATHLSLVEKTYKAEDRRDHLLRVQNAAMLRSGIRFLLGLTSVEEMGRELAAVADFVLEASGPACTAMLAERYPEFSRGHAGEIAIIGMGKLGGMDFNVASDCDVLFLYEQESRTAKVTASEYFSRWAAKFLDFEERKSRLGFLYHMDARLRPHGANSPLASSLASFQSYFLKEAQFWEKMAFSRARFICGNPRIAEALPRLKEEILFSRPMCAAEIQELLTMRKKIEIQKKEETLKAGPGGLIDVEFIAQALVLRYGSAIPALRLTSTMEVLRVARAEAVMPVAQVQALEESYTFLREVENRLRIVNNVSLDTIPTDSEELEKITRRYALRLDTDKLHPDQFMHTIAKQTQTVRSIFNQFFADLLRHTP